MTWFKVDDKFHQHAKVLQIPRAIRPTALGTWILAGTWSANSETDGYVPTYVLDELAGSVDGAQALVDVKLWKKRPKGYQFVNWHEFQFTREQNDARREAERVRKAAQREAARARKNGASSDIVPLGQSSVPSTPSSPGPDPDPDPDHERLSSSVNSDGTTSGSSAQDFEVDAKRVRAHLEAMTGRSVTAPQAWLVVGLILERNPNPKRPTAYVLQCITRDPIGWQNYLDTGREPE